MFKTNKTVCVVLALLVVALGIVGHMDYEDARMLESVEEQHAFRLECQSTFTPSSSQQPFAVRRFTVNGIDAIDEDAVQTVFHCIAVDE